MEFLISFYDNALIYYPNIFFVVSFFISILGIILVSIGIIVLGKKIRSILEQIKRIKIKERNRISLAQITRVFFERKRTFFVSILGFLIVFFSRMIKIVFIRTNAALEYIESQTERIIKRIGKEVLIEE